MFANAIGISAAGVSSAVDGPGLGSGPGPVAITLVSNGLENAAVPPARTTAGSFETGEGGGLSIAGATGGSMKLLVELGIGFENGWGGIFEGSLGELGEGGRLGFTGTDERVDCGPTVPGEGARAQPGEGSDRLGFTGTNDAVDCGPIVLGEGARSQPGTGRAGVAKVVSLPPCCLFLRL